LRDIEVRHGARVALAVPGLAVAAGEVLALVGPNGAGKSTLLAVSALLRRPERGEVWIGGELGTRRAALRLRRRVAVVFQDPLLFDRSVLANAAAGPRFRGADRRAAEATAATWLDRFGVGHLAARPARALSGGEAQRVNLARAFAVAPDLLLLDEPFAALDPPTRAALVPELATRLREAGTAAVLVTHDLAEALALGHRLGVMLDGRVAQLGAPADAVTRPASVAVAAFFGVANLLPARVTGVFGDRVDVVLAGGEARVVAAVPDIPPRVGEAVVLALPARHVEVWPAGDPAPVGWNALAGVVAAVAVTPTGQEATVDCGGVRLVAAVPLPGRSPLAVGQAVVAGIAPDAAYPIADGGRSF